MITILISNEQGEVLDQFKVKDKQQNDHPVPDDDVDLSNDVRHLIDKNFETEDDL